MVFFDYRWLSSLTYTEQIFIHKYPAPSFSDTLKSKEEGKDQE